MTDTSTVGSAWSQVGGFIGNVGNAAAQVYGAIKPGQNANNAQPTAAQTAASQSNFRLIIIAGSVVVALVFGVLLFAMRGGKASK